MSFASYASWMQVLRHVSEQILMTSDTIELDVLHAGENEKLVCKGFQQSPVTITNRTH